MQANSPTMVDWAVAAISAVKAFKPMNLEHGRASKFFRGLPAAANALNHVWSITSAIAEFVQGFWFGSKPVCEDKGHSGAVVAVFWTSLITTNNLQICISQRGQK